MPQNFTARSAGIPPETEYEKAPFRSRGASAGTLQIVPKRPKFSGAQTRRETTHHQILPHILNMSLQPFCLTWSRPILSYLSMG